jgi:CRISPR-associated protein Csy1
MEGRLTFKLMIDSFLNDRLQTKLEKLPDDDPKRPDLIASHQRGPWLKSASQRVKQIQAVTHSLKPIHPDARGTSLYVTPSELSAFDDVVGSHVLGDQLESDVVGNAASLDVYKLLKLEVAGRSLLQALLDNDLDALRALDDDPVEAQSLREALTSLTSARDNGFSTHERAKQLYWLTGRDADDDTQYHLLAPLYPTSLAQVVFEEVQDARFGESNKAARQARRKDEPHDMIYREYRGLAVQKLGGTKPQNISQLNIERGGNNYLLSSLPPLWQVHRSYLPTNTRSIFDRSFGARPAVRQAIKRLQATLLSDRPKNMHVRDHVDTLIEEIIDELVTFAGELSREPAGWTRGPSFETLAKEEQLWLDPLRAELPDEAEFAELWLENDWPEKIGKRFGTWLNGQLRSKLPEVGFIESREWRRRLFDESSTWSQHLRHTREQLDAPKRTPSQEQP